MRGAGAAVERLRQLSVATLICAAVCGCGEGAVLVPAPPPLEPALAGSAPEQLGPHAVGVTHIETTDGEEGGRTLPVEVWYPAEPAEGVATAHYQLTLGTLVLADIESPNGAVRDARLDYRGAPHPVVIFSHGFGGTRIQSVYLAEHLASHGFVVAAPDHVGNTFAEVVDTSRASTSIESARVRPIDVSRTLDSLLERADMWPDELLAFASDPDRVAVAGHSFGGFTAWRIAGASIDVSAGEELCTADPGLFFCDGWPSEKPFPDSARDERFIAALPQAPGGTEVFQREGLHDVAVPTMIQAGRADQTTPFELEARVPFAELTAPAYLLAIEGAGHFTFSDMCSIMEIIDIQLEEFDDGCSADNIPYADAHAIINRFATAFLKMHVAGDTSFPYAAHLSADTKLPATATLAVK